MPLSNASTAVLRPPSHGSRSGWFATPFLCDSFIHYFTPVYPDAIQAQTPALHGKPVFEMQQHRLKNVLAEFFPSLRLGEDRMAKCSRVIAAFLSIADL